MPEHTERILDALEASTRTTTQVMGEMGGLKESLGARICEVESELGTMNAHLDNLVRETQITNQLLRDDMEDRRREAAVKQEVETEERQWRRQLELRRLDRKDEVEDDTRALYKKVGSEAWSVSKQPLAWLTTGIIGWILLHFLGLPPGLIPGGP